MPGVKGMNWCLFFQAVVFFGGPVPCLAWHRTEPPTTNRFVASLRNIQRRPTRHATTELLIDLLAP